MGTEQKYQDKHSFSCSFIQIYWFRAYHVIETFKKFKKIKHFII